MRSAIRLALFALVLHTAFAQNQPDVAEILKKVGQTYAAAKQYELVSKGHERKDAAGMHMLFAFQAPDRYRMEGKFPGLSGDDAAFDDTVIICDGSTVWFYLPKTNQYGSFPVSKLTPDAQGDLGDLRPEAMDQFVMMRYRRATDFIAGARFLPEQAIDLAGRKVDCYVLAIPEEGETPAATWWIDKQRHRIVREDHSASSFVFTTIKFNEPLPDDLFTFKPPPGARELETNR
jgi:outer membrane lipoprotein-sorting protein